MGIFRYFGSFLGAILVYHYPPAPPWTGLTCQEKRWTQRSLDSCRLSTGLIYRKIPLISPGPIQLRKGFWGGLINGGAYKRYKKNRF